MRVKCPVCKGTGWEDIELGVGYGCSLCNEEGEVDLAVLDEEVRLLYFSCIIPKFLKSSSQMSRE